MTNPHKTNPSDIRRHTSLPPARAKVVSADGHPEDDGYHTIEIRIYGDDVTYRAPVMASLRGSTRIPSEDDDVLVVFAAADKPWVIGSWYPGNRVVDGEIDLPEYEPGERVIGTPHTTSNIYLDEDGNITIETESGETVTVAEGGPITLESDGGKTVEVNDTDVIINGGTKGAIHEVSTTEDSDGHVTSVSVSRRSDILI